MAITFLGIPQRLSLFVTGPLLRDLGLHEGSEPGRRGDRLFMGFRGDFLWFRAFKPSGRSSHLVTVDHTPGEVDLGHHNIRRILNLLFEGSFCYPPDVASMAKQKKVLTMHLPAQAPCHPLPALNAPGWLAVDVQHSGVCCTTRLR